MTKEIVAFLNFANMPINFNVLLTVHLSIFILKINQIDSQNLFYNKFISCLYMFRATCAHRQEVKIVLYSLWYRHNYTWPSGAQIERGLTQSVHGTATYRCVDTRGCIIQFYLLTISTWCSKHV